MASRKRKSAKTNARTRVASEARAKNSKPLSLSRRQWMIGAVCATGALGGASALHAWDVRTQEQHDLTVIGEGTPVVVQVHDRSCPTCRRLKSTMGEVMKERTDVLFRIADIAKSDGQELQRRYDVPKVSLLFFDGSGKHLHSHTGLQTARELTDLIDNVMNRLPKATT